MFLSFKDAVEELRADVKKTYRETLPFASVVALTRTATAARDAVRKAMPEHFDRPTPFTIRSVQSVPATKETMSAAVIVNKGRAGSPSRNFIVPEIDSGDRSPKASEVALQLAGVMAPGQFEIPGKGAPLDAFGNISRAAMVQLLSATKARLATPAVVRRSHKRGGLKTRQTGTPFFVVKSKATGQPLGIWQVVSKGRVEPVLVFTGKDPHYETRLPFDRIVEKIADASFGAELEKALLRFSS